MNADHDIGQWNTFHVTVQGSTVTARTQRQTHHRNGSSCRICQLEGSIGLQHHGGPNGPDGSYSGIPALLQFRNIYVKELP